MSQISKLRSAADYLFEQGKYDEAYYIYDEIYRQIWGALGSVQRGLSDFSQGYLNNSFKPSIEFKNTFTVHAANATFYKWFNLDLDQTLNEFIFTTSGHLQCVCYCQTLFDQISKDVIYHEFLILYTLIIRSVDESWISHLLRIAIPTIEDKRIQRLRPMLSATAIEEYLIDNASKIKTTDWFHLNVALLDYLTNKRRITSKLYKSIREIVGNYSSNNQKGKKKSSGSNSKDSKEEAYSKYEKYEKYERYEKYEKYEKSYNSREEFNFSRSTDFEKARYFGKVLGLEGRLTKAEIRRKYLEVISKYHPDRVEGLGDELKELAERKTKEINLAYEWMKVKYNI